MRVLGSVWLSFLLLSACGPCVAFAGDVVISEIMYHPYHASRTPENTAREWIELFNRGAEPVQLSDWRLADVADFAFPHVVLGVGEYLVVAANVEVFATQYPAVTNVVGGWTGWLSNSDEQVTLCDGAGATVDSVRYADEGDWSMRELGPLDYSQRGWQWVSEHDGGGKSLELVNTGLPNEFGQNWSASRVDGGTPGRANSVASGDIAPMILDVAHSPIIPGPADEVTVTARILDEGTTNLLVTLWYRLDTSTYTDQGTYPRFDANDFERITMFDDGSHGDREAGDGVFGAEILAQSDGEIVEFFVEATDSAGNRRTWPAPSRVDGESQQVTNALYQVLGSFDPTAPWTPGSQPVYLLTMTENERARLADIGNGTGALGSEDDSDSNAHMNGTFISVDGTGTELRYGVGIRNQGKGSRDNLSGTRRNNYRVAFPADARWSDLTAVNIRNRFGHVAALGSAVWRMADLPAERITPIQVRVNGQNLALTSNIMFGSYASVEVIDDEFVARHFPSDREGNAYRCIDNLADLGYEGTDPNRYRGGYEKQTNSAAGDYSDLIHLTYVLNNTASDRLVEDVRKVIHLDKWLRYLAVDALCGNLEGGLTTPQGEDYALYCGILDTRFWLIPHDLDTLFGQGDKTANYNRRIHVYAGLDGLHELLTHPDVLPLYHAQLLDLIATVFSPAQFDPLVDRVLGDYVPEATRAAIKQFVVQRNAAVLAQIPQHLTVGSTLPISSGYPYTTDVVYALSGQANAAAAKSVLVNGTATSWSAQQGTWQSDGLSRVEEELLLPGINRVVVESFDAPDGAGNKLEEISIDLWYDDGDVSEISGTPASDTVLQAAVGPWHVTATLTVPAGVTLEIEPGATLFFHPGTGLVVYGRLIAEGSPYRQIRLTRVPGLSNWAGMQFLDTQQESRLAYVVMEHCDAGSCAIRADHARVAMDHVVWANHSKQYLIFDDSSIALTNSVLPDLANAELVHYWGFPSDGYALFEGNVFGSTTGYNDIIDFTGGQRPGPIARFMSNIFTGGSDDCIDLDGADAHVEGNVFMHIHADAPRETLSHAVTTGTENGKYSELTVVRNLFYDVDHAMLSKDGGFITAVNNTIVKADDAAVNMYEARSGQWQGLGFYGDGNIFHDVAHLFANPDWAGHPTAITMHNSIFPEVETDPLVWSGTGNLSDVDPQLSRATNIIDPLQDMCLFASSPARGTGPNGRDMGGLVPAGASVSGEPFQRTWRTDATLTVGGPDIYAYRYRINDGAWSEEVPRPDAALAGDPQPLPAIEIDNLQDGQSYSVYVIGKDSAGVWQSDDAPTASRSWIVDTAFRRLVINEVLALNDSAVEHEGTFPDGVELYYDGPTPISLAGMRLSDDPQQPAQFVFPAGAAMNPGDYVILYADDAVAASGYHLGFKLDGEGDAVYLYDATGELIDSVEFGAQLPDLSIGRVGPDEAWHLTVPTLGQPNLSSPLGDPRKVRVNEWLASGEVLFDSDFVELYNPNPLPVDLGGFYLTDTPETEPTLYRIRPLSFIGGEAHIAFTADDRAGPGYLGFKLSSAGDMIALFDTTCNEIDKIIFCAQTTDVSQGRAPDGTDRFEYFILPTPGLPNPTPPKTIVTTVALVADGAAKRATVPASADEVPADWRAGTDFDDTTWLSVSGEPGGVGYERGTGYEGWLGLDVETLMYGLSTTCYIRIPFSLTDDPAAFTGLYLSTRYDDGFVAHLNGEEVARANAPAALQWNSAATASHEAGNAGSDMIYDLSDRVDLLHTGDNLLAIQAMNNSTTSTDFIMAAVLEGESVETVGDDYPYSGEQHLLEGLRVTELMYNARQGDEFDYIELQNVTAASLDLTGVRFTSGIDFTFPPMTLAPGECTLVVSDVGAFQSLHGTGIRAAGQYSGRLSNGGENLVLKLASPFDAAILRFRYDDGWYPSTDGGGESLEIKHPTARAATWSDAESWQPSLPSPGEP